MYFLAIKRVDSEEYEDLSTAEKQRFVVKLIGELGADKVIENCIYHNHHSGINTTIFGEASSLYLV